MVDGAIVAALTGDGPLTLFAPTDAAFQKLQMALGITAPAPGKTCDLDAETLAAVLTYHVTPGRRFVTGLGGIFNSYYDDLYVCLPEPGNASLGAASAVAVAALAGGRRQSSRATMRQRGSPGGRRSSARRMTSAKPRSPRSRSPDM